MKKKILKTFFNFCFQDHAAERLQAKRGSARSSRTWDGRWAYSWYFLIKKERLLLLSPLANVESLDISPIGSFAKEFRVEKKNYPKKDELQIKNV